MDVIRHHHPWPQFVIAVLLPQLPAEAAFQERSGNDICGRRLHRPAWTDCRRIEGAIAFDEPGPFGGPAIGDGTPGQRTSDTPRHEIRRTVVSPVLKAAVEFRD